MCALGPARCYIMSSLRKRFRSKTGGSTDQISRSTSNGNFASDDSAKDKVANTNKGKRLSKEVKKSLSNRELKMLTVMKEKNFAASRRQKIMNSTGTPSRR